jgi:virginiamycin B lyase
MRTLSSIALFSILSANFLSAGVFKEYSIATPASTPAGIVADGSGKVWFTELDGNKIGRIDSNGQVTEFAVPTSGSGPLEIVEGPGGFWFTESRGNRIGRITPAGVIIEYTTPTAGSGPRGISEDLWFTEFGANKIGRLAPDVGVIAEYAIPTPDSGPSGIVLGPDQNHWFTEFLGNKIGRITPNGSIREFSIPTPNSGPLGISVSTGALWFTESNANKIGRITPDGAIVEFDLPTPNARPTEIRGEWFTEMLANQIGHISYDGNITEYRIPTPGSMPRGISEDFRGIWFTETASHKVGLLERELLVIVGAGYAPPWDTEVALANGQSDWFFGWIGPNRSSLGACLSCPGAGVSVPPNGTGKTTGETVLWAYANASGLYTFYVVPQTGVDPPTATARIVNRSRPTQTIELPVVRYSTIEALNPLVLAFPGAERSTGSHSNLVLAELSREPGRELSIRVEAYSATGDRLGSAVFHVSTGDTLFLVDVLSQMGIGELEAGQIRVTKTGGSGLMWGLLATVSDDGRISVSPGRNP